MLFQLLDGYLRSEHRPKAVRKLYSLILRILTGLYWLGYLLRRFAYRFGIIKPVRTGVPVISVGNLTWGGTGKTPFVIYLASKLENKGNKVCILTRGYRRKSKEQIVLNRQNSNQVSWQTSGDEPYLIWRSLNNSAVIINSRRAKAALWAEENLKPDVLILDDGFQHWKLARDLDLVLLNSQSPFGNGRLIPLGILREPLKALSRADFVLLSKVTEQKPMEWFGYSLEKYYSGELPQFRYKLVSIEEKETGKRLDKVFLNNKKLLAFCGIGHPDSFFWLLENYGFQAIKKMSFPDHYSYDRFDYLTLEKEALHSGADYLATTAKDGLKIPPNLQLQLPVLIFHIEVEFMSGEKALWQKIERILKPLSQTS